MNDDDPPIIELENVSVFYGAFQALRQVSLRIPRGATGLIGRNGAGKSTLLRLLLGLVRASEGSGRVLGIELSAPGALLRRTVGYMPENDALVTGLHGLEQVALAGELCGLSRRQAIRRAHEVLAYVDLGEARYRAVEQYSTGMRQRLKLAVCLVHDPRLLLLDEPTVGLDPPARARMLELLRDLTMRRHKSLVICTHLLGDIESACQTVVMIEAGKVLTSGSMAEALRHRSNHYRLRWDGDGSRFLESLQAQGARLLVESNGQSNGVATKREGEVEVSMPPDFDCRQFFHLAHASEVRLRMLAPGHEDLSQLYHRLIDREAQRGG